MTLAEKISSAMLEMGKVEKRGRNDFQKYDYMLEGDMFAAIRAALSKQGVAVIPSVEDVTELGQKLLVKMSVLMTDGETQISSVWYGEGNAKSGGIYAAYTGALKYWAQKTFLISTSDAPVEAMDPERFDGMAAKPNGTVKKVEKRNGVQSTIWALIGAMTDLEEHVRNAAAKRHIKTAYGAYSTANMSAEDLEEFAEFLESMDIKERCKWARGLTA